MQNFTPVLRDSLDPRDFKTRDFGFVTKLFLPERVDLSSAFTVKNQGIYGSCQSHAVSSAIEYVQNLNRKPSRAFVYYNARKEGNRLPVDGGATVRETLKAVANFGVSNEGVWKYTAENIPKEPSKLAYAITKKSFEYSRVSISPVGIAKALSDGVPVVICYIVRENMIGNHIVLPKGDGEIIGGHAVLAVGYDNKKGLVKILNSHGSGVYENGFQYIRYSEIKEGEFYDFWRVG